jgi:diaminohydroxyphosphoribosylaminopyrimidine deaminase/5-amino-6-(5-phosphoribosylamino)uracil reductase
MAEIDEKFMKIALRLGEKGKSKVEPNPAVGCVIVKDGQVLGKGWHKKFGAPHAEINALENCRKNDNDPAGTDMYVTLEPCCHHGKTPPCTEAIIKAGIGKVFIALEDPTEKVAGKGIRQLRKNGIEVETGICKKRAELLNAPFIKYSTKKIPWIILKWAQTIDGSLGHQDKTRHRWVTNEKSRKDVHRLRRQVNGILVGIETVLEDDPVLTARPARKDRPLTRIVLDSKLRIPENCQLVKTISSAPLVVFTTRTGFANKEKIANLSNKGSEIIQVKEANGQCELKEVIGKLGEKEIDQLLVEGGAKVTCSFLREELANQAIIYIAPKIHGVNSTANILQTTGTLENPLQLHKTEIKKFGEDIRITALLNPVF